MTEQERYAWLQLAFTPYIGAESFRRLLDHFGSASEVLRAPESLITQLLTHNRAAVANAWRNTSKAQAACEAALSWEQQAGCTLLLSGDADFPTLLHEGLTPPPVLFVRGHVHLLSKPAVSIVGSRHATPQAMRIAGDFGRALSEHGIGVVSGMAAGIDGAAHWGALQGAGSTIAILGTGIDRIYPQSHHELAHQIAEHGALVSEFPLGTRPLAGNFPRRNRLIAALGYATLVVEAALESGSLITARLAAEMGREVMAIPGSIDNPHSKGCHKLIKEGAKLVECLDDILSECPILQTPNTVCRQPAPSLPTNLSTKKSNQPNPKKITTSNTKIAPQIVANPLLDAMGYDPIHPDLLAEKLNLSTADVYAQLLEWELEGIIKVMAGGRYQRIT